MRALEHTGLGILAGCALGLPLAAIAIWRSMPTTPLVAGSLFLGAAAGLLLGCINRPTAHDAASETDRQLDTSDLLSTAYNIRHSADRWAAAVRMSANQWARRTNPSAVILNRFGARAWGGIGLATMLLVVLTLFPTYATPTQAANHLYVGNVASNSPQDRNVRQSPVQSARSIPQQDPEDLHPSQISSDDPATPPPNDTDATKPDQSSRSPSHPDRLGQGGAESHSNAQPGKVPGAMSATQSQTTSPKGRLASGVGESTARPSGMGSNSDQFAGNHKAADAAPPWKSAQWTDDARRARHAVESGQVPDQYRDVIGGYFKPQ